MSLVTIFAHTSASGLLASIARLAYQIPEANQPNKTMIVMVLLLLKYVTIPHIPRLTH